MKTDPAILAPQHRDSYRPGRPWVSFAPGVGATWAAGAERAARSAARLASLAARAAGCPGLPPKCEAARWCAGPAGGWALYRAEEEGGASSAALLAAWLDGGDGGELPGPGDGRWAIRKGIDAACHHGGEWHWVEAARALRRVARMMRWPRALPGATLGQEGLAWHWGVHPYQWLRQV